MAKPGARELTTTVLNAPMTVKRLASKWSAGKWRIAMLVGVLLSGAGTAFAVRAYNSIRHEPARQLEDRPSSDPSTAATPVTTDAVAPAPPSDASRADKPLVPATPAASPAGAGGPASGNPASGNPASRNTAGAKSAAQGPAESKARQLARVWVYGDAVYPSAIKLKPGTVLLRMENQVGFNVNLVLTKLTGGGTGPVTTLGAQGKTLRSIQVLELGAGLYEYYDQSRPQIKGRLIVEP